MARHATVVYVGNATSAALTVAGSVGSGLLLAQARTGAGIGSFGQELSQRRGGDRSAASWPDAS